MTKEINPLCKLRGQRLKRARRLLVNKDGKQGMSQAEFCTWLKEQGFVGQHDEEYKVKTIAAWENGRRNVPIEILSAVANNAYLDNDLIQYAYLNGDSDFITKSVEEMKQKASERLADETSAWMRDVITNSDDMIKDPRMLFNSILFDELFYLYGYSRNDIYDQLKFQNYAFVEFKKIIDDYIKNEKAWLG